MTGTKLDPRLVRVLLSIRTLTPDRAAAKLTKSQLDALARYFGTSRSGSKELIAKRVLDRVSQTLPTISRRNAFGGR